MKKDEKQKKANDEQGAEEEVNTGAEQEESSIVNKPIPNPYHKDITEKDELLALYQKLKDLGINSIGDLEVKISRL